MLHGGSVEGIDTVDIHIDDRGSGCWCGGVEAGGALERSVVLGGPVEKSALCNFTPLHATARFRSEVPLSGGAARSEDGTKTGTTSSRVALSPSRRDVQTRSRTRSSSKGLRVLNRGDPLDGERPNRQEVKVRPRHARRALTPATTDLTDRTYTARALAEPASSASPLLTRAPKLSLAAFLYVNARWAPRDQRLLRAPTGGWRCWCRCWASSRARERSSAWPRARQAIFRYSRRRRSCFGRSQQRHDLSRDRARDRHHAHVGSRGRLMRAQHDTHARVPHALRLGRAGRCRARVDSASGPFRAARR
jgi:hypothetical protein